MEDNFSQFQDPSMDTAAQAHTGDPAHNIPAQRYAFSYKNTDVILDVHTIVAIMCLC